MKRAGRQDAYLLQELLTLAFRLDIQVRQEVLGDEESPARSGLAYLEGNPVIFLDRRLSDSAAADVLVEALASFPLGEVYLKPAVRKLLEHWKSQDHEFE